MSEATAATSADARVSPLAMLAWTLPQVAVAGLATIDARLWAGDQRGIGEYAVQAMVVAQSATVGLLLPVLARSGRTAVATLASGTAFLCLAGVLQNDEWAEVARKCGWAMPIFATVLGLWQLTPSAVRPVFHAAIAVTIGFSQVLAYVSHDVAGGEKSDIFRTTQEFLPTAAYEARKALCVAILGATIWTSVVLLARRRRRALESGQTACAQAGVHNFSR